VAFNILTTPATDATSLARLSAVVGAVIPHPVDGQNLFAVDPALPTYADARITVAAVEGRLAGATATYRVNDRTGWLVSLAVLPGYRHRGVAHAFVRRAVQDRDLIDGRRLTLYAQVRVLPDGSLNHGSARALEAAGFTPLRELRVDVAAGGLRAAHLAATAESDGYVRSLLLVRVGTTTVEEGR